MRDVFKYKDNDEWVLAVLADGNAAEIVDLREYFPKRLGKPFTLSSEVFEKLHTEIANQVGREEV